MTERLVDAHRVARLLNVSVQWVYAASARGDLPSLKIGRLRRFRESEIVAWLENHAEGPRAAGGPRNA